jgi:hypothetical protein
LVRPTYLRSTGDVSTEHHAGAEVATASGTTLCELLYFGNGRDRP